MSSSTSSASQQSSSSSSSLLSPRPMVDKPTRIIHVAEQEDQVRILRPTPRRPQQHVLVMNGSKEERRSLTDPRHLSARTVASNSSNDDVQQQQQHKGVGVGFVHANPVKLRSLSPCGLAQAEQDGGMKAGGFVTSVKIDKEEALNGGGEHKEDKG